MLATEHRLAAVHVWLLAQTDVTVLKVLKMGDLKDSHDEK